MALRILDKLQLEEGNIYELWLRGRRRLYLLGKHEPDMFIDYITGTSFKDACYYYWAYTKNEKYYNRRRNTYKGHVLYVPQVGTNEKITTSKY